MNRQLSPKRLARLQLPRIANEVQTIRVMTEIYCHHQHGAPKGGLCPHCRAFLDYAVWRLACCPFEENKPVCRKCKIHCFQKAFKAQAKEVMAFAGPRLLWRHPILSIRHLMDCLRAAPDKPRAKISKNTETSKNCD